MLTQDQLNNIHKLPLEDVKKVHAECEEALGVTDLETASKVLGVSKRQVYYLMTLDNSVQIGRHKFPCINLMVR